MRVFDMVVNKRHEVAETLAGLAPEQLRQQSLCDQWTVHDVAAHLVSLLRFGGAKLFLGVLATAGDVSRAIVTLTRWQARLPSHELIELLHRHSRSRATPPRAGFDPVLTDLVVHDLDIRRPLGIARPVQEEPLWVALHHLSTVPALGYEIGDRLDGLRLVATDTGWTHGRGPVVQGAAESLLLGMSGRTVAFDELTGDGVPILRQRVSSPPHHGPGRRLAMAFGSLAKPPPRDRRTRHAVGRV